jgi:hypothetical protein
MKLHDDIEPADQDGAVFPEVEHSARLTLLCRLAHTTFTAIEREAALARGSISGWNGRRTYAYPRLQQAVISHLAPRLDVNPAQLRRYLFDPQESASPAVQAQGSRGRNVHAQPS